MAEKDAQSSPVNLLQAPIRVKQWRGWLDKPDASATLQNKSNSCSFLRRGRHLTPDDEEAEDDVAEGLIVVLVVARHEPRHDIIFVLCSRRALPPPRTDDVRGKPVDVGDGSGGIWVQIDFYREEIAPELSSGRIHARRGNTRRERRRKCAR
jgi:hypothetical protein